VVGPVEPNHLESEGLLPKVGGGYTRQVSVFGPGRALSRRVNLCCVLPTPDGDAKRIHGGLSWFGRRRPYV
jgi:hypothetical protein